MANKNVLLNICTENYKLSYDIEVLEKKMHLLDLRIKTIHFLFYYYVFNSNQK